MALSMYIAVSKYFTRPVVGVRVSKEEKERDCEYAVPFGGWSTTIHGSTMILNCILVEQHHAATTACEHIIAWNLSVTSLIITVETVQCTEGNILFLFCVARRSLKSNIIHVI